MSDARSFAPVDESTKSPEERLAELERIWPIIQQKLQSYDVIVNNFRLVETSLSAQGKLLANHTDMLSDASSALLDIKSNVSEELDQIKPEVSNLHPKINSVFAICEDIKKTFTDKHNQALGEFETVRRETSKRLHEFFTVDIPTVKSELEAKIKELSTQMTSMQLRHAELYSVVEKNQSQLDGAKANSVKANDLAFDAGNKLNGIIAALESHKVFTSSMVMNEVNKIKQDVTTAIDGFKKQIDATPESIASFKAEIVKQLESVALDGSNAVLKASNSSQQIMLLEKKIENIFLTLKKLELK